MESYKFLQNYNLKFNKIASPMLTNYELAKTIAKIKLKHLFQLACLLWMK